MDSAPDFFPIGTAGFDGQHQPAGPRRRLADVEELAVVLGISPKTIWRMIDARRLPGVCRLGRIIRVDLEVVNRWIDAGCPALSRWKRTDSK